MDLLGSSVSLKNTAASCNSLTFLTPFKSDIKGGAEKD